MERDPDLCRAILLATEREGPGPNSFSGEPLTIPGFTNEQVNYHIYQLWDGGFLKIANLSTSDGDDYRIRCLTSKGHDFLDAVRNETVWVKIKTRLGNKLASAGLDIILAVATQELRKFIGLAAA